MSTQSDIKALEDIRQLNNRLYELSDVFDCNDDERVSSKEFYARVERFINDRLHRIGDES